MTCVYNGHRSSEGPLTLDDPLNYSTMYNDHKTSADRLARSSRSIELSPRAFRILAILAIGLLLMAGRADFQAVQAGLI